jgi:hypothetical protein
VRILFLQLHVTRLVGGTPAGAPAAVEAVLGEVGTLVDERDGKAMDTYNSAYTVRYLLEDSADGGGYRLTRAAVLAAESNDA